MKNVLQKSIFSVDDRDFNNALENFNKMVREGWADGFLIATDSLRVEITNHAIVIAAIMEKDTE